VPCLSAQDIDGDICEFTLTTGEGDIDNGKFTINNDTKKLITGSEKIYFNTNPVCAIRIRADDGKGGIFEKALTITVNKVVKTLIFSKRNSDVQVELTCDFFFSDHI